MVLYVCDLKGPSEFEINSMLINIQEQAKEKRHIGTT
jgi:hypothetical protein